MSGGSLQLKSFALGLVAVIAPVGLYFAIKSYIKQKESSDINNGKPTESIKPLRTDGKKATYTTPSDVNPDATSRRVLILYATVTGSARKFANEFAVKIERSIAGSAYKVRVVDAKEYDEEQLNLEDVVFFICSTWTGGVAPESAKRFIDGLKDYAYDFRVSKDHLSKIKFAVFGLGSAVYAEHYATVAIEVRQYFVELGATPLSSVTRGDDQSDFEDTFNRWSAAMVGKLIKTTGVRVGVTSNGGVSSSAVSVGSRTPSTSGTQNKTTTKNTTGNAKKGRGSAFQEQQKQVKMEAGLSSASATSAAKGKSNSTCCGGADSGSGIESSSCCNNTTTRDEGDITTPPNDDEEEEEEEDRINNRFVEFDSDEEDEFDLDDEEGGGGGRGGGGHSDSGLVDLEDLEMTVSTSATTQRQRQKELKESMQADGTEREMVTKLQRRALTKEGYRIIGSHSAVKLCRWTKNQMRGRGGCYKHTFYGITSYQCMEATPSLACANKCVFCWRHHKNPVGTEWRWKADEPAHIVEEAVELHRAMINEMKGIPGVQPERLQEAYTVRHCALSLVGEPIMYPRINEMLKELHDRDISSFLVTNAQFPERIEQLDPVTQLYVSVDASTRDSLKAIDRPLFKDFWERFLDSLKAMKAKQQRTVYRLTLVKEWNMKEAEGYVDLIELGQPDFIEIKSVTYCGKSDASSLTMQNVPWHYECCQFSEAIANRLAERGKSVRYSIATEHEHSCCVLLAREDKFKVDGVWHTWIDYPKFHQLVREYHASGKTKTFTSEDYMAPTPSWALYKSEEHGFDPVESRWKRNKAGALVPVEYKSSESGCG